jgi:hypothetical protein
MERKRRLRGRSLGVRHTGEERELAVKRGLLQRHDEGKHASGALRLSNRKLTDRADPHMCVHGCGLVGFESTKDVTGDQVVDVSNVICG